MLKNWFLKVFKFDREKIDFVKQVKAQKKPKLLFCMKCVLIYFQQTTRRLFFYITVLE